MGRPEIIEDFTPGPNGDGFLEQYKELARLMYEVRRLCPRVSLLGASAVNPGHPLPADHLELLAALAKHDREGAQGNSEKSYQQVHLPSISLMIRGWIRGFLTAVRDTLRLMKLKWRLAPLLRKAKQEPATVIMKTWSFGPESLKGLDDFYYGKLPTLLRERGVSCLLLCGDFHGLCGDFHGGDEEVFARTALERTRIRSMPERVLIPLWAPLLTVFDQMRASLSLRYMARRSKNQKFAMVCAHASVNCLSRFAKEAALYFYIAKVAVRSWRPRVFVTLYEGQIWEKPAWHGAKAGSKNCLIVGYQHTVIMPHSVALLLPNRDSWEFSVPDVVLCLGEATRKMMQAGHEPHKTKLITFGSFRYSPDGTVACPPKPDRRTVLVVPESHSPEIELLFDFAMRAAPLLPDHRFILRCHPASPFKEIRQRLLRAPEDLPNVEVSSHRSITDDLSRSSAVLYRGSSAVLSAVLHGLKPIYLHDGRHPDVDPIFELNGWKERVTSERELEEILRRYAAQTEKLVASQWRSAWGYVSRYAMLADDGSVDRFVRAAGLQGS